MDDVADDLFCFRDRMPSVIKYIVAFKLGSVHGAATVRETKSTYKKGQKEDVEEENCK